MSEGGGSADRTAGDHGVLYTMAQAARLKGVNYHTVSRAVRRGKLPVRRLGHQVLIAAADLDAWSPMYQRAPRKYRRRDPDLGAAPALLGAAGLDRLERAELEGRVAALAAALVARAPGLDDGALRALAARLAELAAAARPGDG